MGESGQVRDSHNQHVAVIVTIISNILNYFRCTFGHSGHPCLKHFYQYARQTMAYHSNALCANFKITEKT